MPENRKGEGEGDARLGPLRRKALGTADTIREMHRLVAESKLDPVTLKIAHWIRTKCLGQKDHECQARAILRFLKTRGLFVRHPHQVQKLDTVRGMIQGLAEMRRAGVYRGDAWFMHDCPGFSIMGAAIAGALGFPYAFETVIADAKRPDEFSHVYPAVWIEGRGWTPIDGSSEPSTLGWRPALPKSMFRLWAEPKIEDALPGAAAERARRRWAEVAASRRPAHRLNGSARAASLGDGDGGAPPPMSGAEAASEIPRDDVREGPLDDMQVLPKEFFKTIPERRPGCPDFGHEDVEWVAMHYPIEPSIPHADLEDPPPRWLRRDPKTEPEERLPVDAGYLSSRGRPWYRYPRPGLSKENPYYPTWPHQRQVALRDVDGRMARQVSPHHHDSQSGISRHPFRVPGFLWDRNVRAMREDEPKTVVDRAERDTAALEKEADMAGLGQIVPTFTTEETAAEKAAREKAAADKAKADAASSDVLTSIWNTIKGAVPAYAEAARTALLAKAQASVEAAKAKVLQSQAEAELARARAAGQLAPPERPWYSRAEVIIPVALVGVVGIALAAKAAGASR